MCDESHYYEQVDSKHSEHQDAASIDESPNVKTLLFMDLYPQDEERTEAAVLEAMVLFSTLTTASEVWQDARERRAGRDPSEQEAEAVVVPYLKTASGELQALLMQLQASRIQADREEEGHIARLVRRYNDLTRLRHVSHLLQVVHQRLLSLFPEIPATLPEQTRILQRQSSMLLEAEETLFQQEIGLFLHHALVYTGRLHREVSRHF